MDNDGNFLQTTKIKLKKYKKVLDKNGNTVYNEPRR